MAYYLGYQDGGRGWRSYAHTQNFHNAGSGQAIREEMIYAKQNMVAEIENLARMEAEITARKQAKSTADRSSSEPAVTSPQAAATASQSQDGVSEPMPSTSSQASCSPALTSTSIDSTHADNVNTTLASQLAVTSVTSSSNLPPPLTGLSNNSDSMSESGMDDSDSPARVIVSDIKELEARQRKLFFQRQQEDYKRFIQMAAEGGFKRKAEEYMFETFMVAKEAKREKAKKKVESSDEEEEEVNEEERLRERQHTVKAILELLDGFASGEVPPETERHLFSLSRLTLLDVWDRFQRKQTHYHTLLRSAPNYAINKQEDANSDEETDPEVLRGDFARFSSVHNVTDDIRVRRLLVFGGIHHTNSSAGTQDPRRNQDFKVITSMIQAGNGQQVVDIVREIGSRGSAARIEGLLFALAMCCRCEDLNTKRAAYDAIQNVCGTPTQIFKLINLIENYGKGSGWGRGLRRALSAWYNQNASNPHRMAMQVTKYWSRHKWSHRDVFRLCHIKPVNDAIGFIVRYAVRGMKEAEEEFLEDGYLDRPELEKVHKYLKAVEEAKRCDNVERVVHLVQEHDLVREQLRTEMLNEPAVWSVMLPSMPLMALIRNLPKMTKLDLFQDPEKVQTVISKLTNLEALKKARVHPLKILIAHHVYLKGTGEKGSLVWTPNADIVRALEQAFYQCFDAVEPTNKRILICLDISGSMSSSFQNYPLQMREASTCMAMITMRKEPLCDIVGFHNKLIPLDMFKDQTKTLTQLVTETHNLGFGSTDCSKPMVWARNHKKEYDAFIIYTDSETNSNRVPPSIALDKYREVMNLPRAKLVVVGMADTQFTIARPDDLHMLDVCGFDADTPELIRSFVAGELDGSG